MPESALEWEPVLVLAWVPVSAQFPALGLEWALESVPEWSQLLLWGRCLGFRLQGEARRQDPSRQWKASGFYPDFFIPPTVRDRLKKDV